MQDKINFEALAVRALKTFIQGFIGAVGLGVTTAVDVPTTKALIVGAIAAGASAVMNLFLAPQEAK